MFDAHLHIIDPRYPLTPNHGFLPAPFLVSDYRERTAGLGVTGGAVVSGSFQGEDTRYLESALTQLGEGFVGVVNASPGTSEERVLQLDRLGVRAVRLNLYRGPRRSLEDLEALARRVHEVAGWHVELYLDTADLPELAPVLSRLPRVVIDHLGMSQVRQDLLLKLVDQGARVKATGFGRVHLDVRQTLRAVHAVNPAALVAGTDLPSTRARRPFSPDNLDLVREVLGEDARAVLTTNAEDLYRPGPRPAVQTTDR